MMRRPTLFALFGLCGLTLLLVGACPEFGNDYPCDDDSECLNGMVCGSGGLCVDEASDAGGVDGGTTDAGDDGGTTDAGDDGGTADAGDDGGTADAGDDGGTADGGGDDGGTVTDCTATFCPVPDSATALCGDGSGVATGCGEVPTDPFYGQDGHRVSPAPAYSLNGQIVVDEITDLWWQMTPNNSTVDLSQADNYCLNLTLQDSAGSDVTGWRLPTMAELGSLADWGRGEGSSTQRLPPEFTPGPDPFFWSSEPDPQANYQFGISYDRAYDDNLSPGSLASVRCVRGTPRWRGPLTPFGSVRIDDTTGLMWAGQIVQDSVGFQAALGLCNAHDEGGATDWRLPTLKEWLTAYDLSLTSGTRLRDWHPADRPGVEYWTSTPTSYSMSSGFYVIHTGINSKILSRGPASPKAVMCVTEVN